MAPWVRQPGAQFVAIRQRRWSLHTLSRPPCSLFLTAIADQPSRGQDELSPARHYHAVRSRWRADRHRGQGRGCWRLDQRADELSGCGRSDRIADERSRRQVWCAQSDPGRWRPGLTVHTAGRCSTIRRDLYPPRRLDGPARPRPPRPCTCNAPGIAKPNGRTFPGILRPTLVSALTYPDRSAAAANGK